MLFTSIDFLFIFFPLSILIYILLNKFINDNRIKNIYIFILSIIFYSWGNIHYVFLLLLVILTDYWLGILIKCNLTSKSGKTYLIIGIIFNLLILATYKYSNFFISNINFIIDNLNIPFSLNQINISLPIGLSFYIFQSISYLVDIYRGNSLPQRNIIGIGLYLSFFANVTSGPIIKYQDFEKQLYNRKCSTSNLYMHIERFILGLCKKLVVAIPLGIYADKIFSLDPSTHSILVSWLGLILYTLQIYIDFSSYSDMAISLAGMFGFEIKENFNYPYTATSIQDFWRRWHISLSTWFKDYLYIPLGGNRHGPLITSRNTIIVFTLCGLWHGANWTFAAWGLYYGVLLSLERIFFKNILNKIFTPLKHIYTMMLIMIGWIFFRSESLEYALSYLSSIFGLNKSNVSIFLGDIINLELLFLLLISLLIISPILNKAFNTLNTNKTMPLLIRYILILLVLFCSFTWLSPTIKGSVEVPFIYTKF